MSAHTEVSKGNTTFRPPFRAHMRVARLRREALLGSWLDTLSGYVSAKDGVPERRNKRPLPIKSGKAGWVLVAAHTVRVPGV